MEPINILDEPRPIIQGAAIRSDIATTGPATIKETVLAQFREAEAAVTALAEKYRAVAYPVETPKGMNDAKAARLELREKGRYAIQRSETRIKTEVNDLKRIMSAEVDRLVAIVQPVEDHIDGQIKARESVLAAEKAERERLAAEAATNEAARVEAHRAHIARIKGYVAQAHGASAAKLQSAIDFLRGVPIDAAYEEFQGEAERARDDTLLTLDIMLDQAQEREAHERQVREQAAENARIAAELAEQRRQIEAQAAELRRQQEAEAQRLAAIQREKEAAELAAQRAESARLEALADANRAAIAAAERSETVTVETVPLSLPEGDTLNPIADQNAQESAPAPRVDEPATLKLGVISERLGFTVSAAFLADVLHIKPARTDGRAALFTEGQYQTLCRQLISHVSAMAELYGVAPAA